MSHKRQCKVFFLFILLAAMLSGCGRIASLPAEPVCYTKGTFSPPQEDTGYCTVEYADKVYILYGSLKGRGVLGNISYAYGDCLGYVENDETDLIYALSGESADVWLIERDSEGFMSVPVVLREIHSKGLADIPDSVEPFGYAYWEENAASGE